MVIQKKIARSDSDMQKHQFALYFSDVTHVINDISKSVVLRQIDLFHRISRVLKLSIGDQFVLFDRSEHVICELIEYTKNTILARKIKHEKNKQLEPVITYLLPLLKKEALQEAVYSLAEIGVNNIQLITTKKSRQNIMQNEMQRLNKTIIAAAEQSKYYAMPEIYAPESLMSCVKKLSDNNFKIIFDVKGSSFFEVCKISKSSNTSLLVGPEGGLTDDEMLMLEQANFKSCVLTPTILRAVQAVAVSAALFRLK